jgi:hypothetical protein
MAAVFFCSIQLHECVRLSIQAKNLLYLHYKHTENDEIPDWHTDI